MGRGKSATATASFCKQQVNEVAQMLDEHVKNGLFHYDFGSGMLTKSNSVALKERVGRNNDHLNRIIRNIPYHEDVPYAIAHLHSKIRDYWVDNRIVTVTPEEAEALLVVSKLNTRIQARSLHIRYSINLEELAQVKKIQVEVLQECDSPEGRRYRHMCKEWLNLFKDDFKFLKSVYDGRKHIKRSDRVSYQFLENLSSRLVENKTPKLDAYKEMRAVKDQVDQAIDNILQTIMDQKELQTITMAHLDLDKLDQVPDSNSNSTDALVLD